MSSDPLYFALYYRFVFPKKRFEQWTLESGDRRDGMDSQPHPEAGHLREVWMLPMETFSTQDPWPTCLRIACDLAKMHILCLHPCSTNLDTWSSAFNQESLLWPKGKIAQGRPFHPGNSLLERYWTVPWERARRQHGGPRVLAAALQIVEPQGLPRTGLCVWVWLCVIDWGCVCMCVAVWWLVCLWICFCEGLCVTVWNSVFRRGRSLACLSEMV